MFCVYHCCRLYLQLLFPGGAKEVNKKVGQEYQLFWKDTPDFVRLAARCGAIIVPFAAVGADDAYDGEGKLSQLSLDVMTDDLHYRDGWAFPQSYIPPTHLYRREVHAAPCVLVADLPLKTGHKVLFSGNM
jgi:hypothetical protein